jgi:chromosome partitioning protein
VYQVLLGLTTAQSVRHKSERGGYDLVPANRELAGAEVEMVALDNRETRLKSALATIALEYDFILLDCPPALNLLTLNGLVAADAVIIPMQCEYFALEGLSDLVETVRKVRKHLNPRLEIEGLLRTMYDPRNSLAQQVSAQLQQHFGDKLYLTIIPRNVRLAEAPSYGAPAVNLDKACKGSQAYLALAQELLSRLAPAPA